MSHVRIAAAADSKAGMLPAGAGVVVPPKSPVGREFREYLVAGGGSAPDEAGVGSAAAVTFLAPPPTGKAQAAAALPGVAPSVRSGTLMVAPVTDKAAPVLTRAPVSAPLVLAEAVPAEIVTAAPAPSAGMPKEAAGPLATAEIGMPVDALPAAPIPQTSATAFVTAKLAKAVDALPADAIPQTTTAPSMKVKLEVPVDALPDTAMPQIMAAPLSPGRLQLLSGAAMPTLHHPVLMQSPIADARNGTTATAADVKASSTAGVVAPAEKKSSRHAAAVDAEAPQTMQPNALISEPSEALPAPAIVAIPVQAQPVASDALASPMPASMMPGGAALEPAGSAQGALSTAKSGAVNKVQTVAEKKTTPSVAESVAVAQGACVQAPTTQTLDVPSVPVARDASVLGTVSQQAVNLNGASLEVQATAVQSSAHAADSTSPQAPAEVISAPQPGDARTISASPQALEVGVASGTHGWLRVRAEMSSTGTIEASVVASSSTASEALHHGLPALREFLAQEQVSVASVAISNAFGTASQRDGGIASSLQSGAEGTGQRDRAPTQSAPVTVAEPWSGEDAAEWSGLQQGHGLNSDYGAGGWVSVRV